MPKKTKLRVADTKLEFASLNFKDMARRVSQSQACEDRGYHVRVKPSQQKVQTVGTDRYLVDLCAECGVWTLSDRFQKLTP